MKLTSRFLVGFLFVCLGSLLHAGNLKVTLSPSQAVNAGAQWRVDGGSWRNSGTTVRNLSNATHQVEFKTVSGWIAPAATSVTLTAGDTTTLTGTYLLPASLTVTLSPTAGQWRIDGGIWRASGTTATGLAPGNHTVDYAPVAGYLPPASETITLSAGQSLPLSRTYVQTGQIAITLNPNYAQWRINGGTWQASGASVANLPPGSYTIDYSAHPPDWGTQPSETVTLSAGQSLALTRNYTLYSQVLIGLVPSTGTWRINGGAWQPSGTSLWVPPGTYTLEYSALAGYDAPSTETFTGGLATTRYYTSTAPTLRVNLTPTTGQWRLDGGAWQASGTQLTGLTTSSHTIDYTDLGGNYSPLASETLSLALRENATLSRSYALKPARLAIVLTPSTQMWRATGPIDTGWFPSAIDRPNMPPGTYTVTYQPLANHDAPPTETITLAPDQSLSLGRTYTPHPGQVTFTLEPATAQWRIYPDNEDTPSGIWQSSGATLTNVPPRGYRIQYSTIAGYTPPGRNTLFVSAGQTFAASETYTPIPPRILGDVTPVQARFRINGGAWEMPDAWVTLPAPGSYLVEFQDVPNFETPAPRTLNLTWGDTHQLDVAYAAVAPASLTVHTSPSAGQFRVDGGAWRSSGSTLSVNAGSRLVEFSEQVGYLTPAPVTLQLAAGETRVHNQQYFVGSAKLKITLEPSSGRWRVDGGNWIPSSWVIYFGSGPHLIEYEPVAGYLTPAPENILLAVDEERELTRSYKLPTASVSIALNPSTGQWRISNGSTPGTWNAAGATVTGLSPGTYTIDYSALSGFTTPPPENLSLAAGDNRSLLRSYTATPGGFSEVVALPDLGYTPGLIRGSDGMIYGFTNQQGGNSGGAFFRVRPEGSDYTLLRAFPAHTNDAMSPASLVDGTDGFIYGAANYGGSETNRGAIFRSSRDGTNFALIRVFVNSAEGLSPNTLLEASDGWLYGTTLTGALNNRGVIFKINKTGTSYTVLKELGAVSLEGRYASRLTEGTDGALYGAVSSGGANGFGLVYRIQKDGGGFTVTKNFAGGADGNNPRVPLFRASDGCFYGTTTGGGALSRGTAFRLNPDGSGHTILKSFAGDTVEGGAPASEFSEENGVLYGGTNSGGPGARGTIFKMNRDGSGYVTLKTFSAGVADGGALMFTPVVVTNGIINGASILGGAGKEGVLFKLNTDGTGFGILKHYGAPFGGFLMTPVVEGSDGALYGTAYIGGVNREGTVFKVNKDGSALTVLRHFSGLRTGFAQSVIKGSDGLLYGVAVGTSSSEIFRMNVDGSGLTTLRMFTTDGSPQAIVEGTDGILYGTTSGGGTAALGSVFKINKDGSGFTTVRSFTGGTTDGKWPYCGVIEGRDGMLYGTTYAGGAADAGTLYRLNKDGSGYAVLKLLTDNTVEGSKPMSPPLHHSDGLLYGVMSTGGTAGSGTVYRVAADGSGYIVLRNLEGSNASYAGLVEHNGRFYGVTAGGGAFGRGTIYSLQPDGSNYTVLINFGATGFEGSVPAATLLRASDGALYGTTARGGIGPVIFRLQTN